MRRSVFIYSVAVAAMTAAVLLRWLLDPYLADTLPVVTLFGAVAVAVWLGGYKPALAAAVLGYLACNYLFIEPRHTFGPVDVPTLTGLAAYAFTCGVIIWIGQAMRVARRREFAEGERLRVTLASIGDAVITTDTDARVTFLNAVAESLTGWTNTDAAGQPLDTVFRIVGERDRQPVASPIAKALRTGTVVGLANHTLLVAKDGTERPIDDSAAPIRDDDGRVVGAVLVFRDITERRQWEKSESERLLSARLLAAIVETSDDAIVSKTLDGTIRTWNAGAERLFGYTAAEAIGRHISLVIPPERIAEEDHIIGCLKAGERVDHFETERVRKDGERVLVSLTVSPIRDAAGNVVGASKIARDITERKRADAERQKFVTLVENSTDFIGMCDLDGVPFYINRAGLDMVGLASIEEARRANVRDFFFPEDRSKIMDEFFPSVVEKGTGEIEVRFRNFRTGQARWMAYKVLQITDSDGRRIAFATVSQDITERRRLADDLRKLAADLSDADRRKNEFLATLAHELRNPLAPLRNILEYLKRGDADAAKREQAVATMQRQLSQLVRLVDDLLELNRITHDRLELRKRTLDVSTVLEHAVESCRPLAESCGHEVRTSVPSEPVYVDADEARLTQVFANLINNSCKYTNPGGLITVAAQRDGSDAVVSVSDNGIGIPPERLSDIFEMFTQVERASERSQGGLGIGLTLVRRLVRMHGGTVEAKSAGAGKGSEFVVRLPLVLEALASTRAPEPRPEEPAASRRILVVDDNRDAATSLAMLLQMTGHETHTAHDGSAAVEIIEKQRPDVVLLDIGLPGLNGYEVCRRVRQQPWGGAMVLVALTGWGQDSDRQQSREAGFDGHLVKPVEYVSLMELLESLAAQKSAARMLQQ